MSPAARLDGLILARILVFRGRLRFAHSDPIESLENRNKRVQVVVRDNNVDQALKVLKKKLQREGVFREMKLRNYYEKPSEKRAREKAEAVRRARKLARKRAQREGLLPMKKPRTLKRRFILNSRPGELIRPVQPGGDAGFFAFGLLGSRLFHALRGPAHSRPFGRRPVGLASLCSVERHVETPMKVALDPGLRRDDGDR